MGGVKVVAGGWGVVATASQADLVNVVLFALSPRPKDASEVNRCITAGDSVFVRSR